MPSVTPARFAFSLDSLLPTRPLDAAGRQRVEALLFAGREEAAVSAYRESTHATRRAAVEAVARIKTRLDASA